MPLVMAMMSTEKQTEQQSGSSAEMLRVYNGFMAPAFRSAITSAGFPAGSHGLDAGCGSGGVIPLFFEAIGAEGAVTGVDASAAHIAEAKQTVVAQRLQDRTTLICTDLSTYLGTVGDNTFDWVWSADVLWPNVFPDQLAVVRQFARIVKPGGVIAIFGGNLYRSVFLPGYSRLEKLAIAASEKRWWVDSYDGCIQHHERAALWLQTIGLTDVRCSIHTAHYDQIDTHHPDIRGYIEQVVLAEYRAAIAEQGDTVGMRPEDRALWERIAHPTAPAYILHQPGYFCFQPGTLVVGRVADNG